jgi:hypothetical protein
LAEKLFNPNHADFCWCNINNKSHEDGLKDWEPSQEEYNALIHELSSYTYLGD